MTAGSQMDFIKLHRIQPGDTPRLGSIETRQSGPFDGKPDARSFTRLANEKNRELQYRLYVERKHSLLLVLQAPDTAGKDGVIRKVLGQMNPQGCRTYSFKVPNSEEAAHDFLWRIHKCTPGQGQISIFNRSHYEDVLVVRVENLVPRDVWSQRFDLINQFEANLVAAGTRIVKFYLHISPQEQLRRLKKRLDNPEKHWKLSSADYAAREKWDAYQKAYEDVIARCNTPVAPWYVIPADNKWYRDAAIAGIVRETLRDIDPRLPPVEVDLDHLRSLYEREYAEQQRKAPT